MIPWKRYGIPALAFCGFLVLVLALLAWPAEQCKDSLAHAVAKRDSIQVYSSLYGGRTCHTTLVILGR